MRNKRDPESGEQQQERTEHDARRRLDQAAAEDKAVDAAIRESIKRHGA
jgi:hypothetical protein